MVCLTNRQGRPKRLRILRRFMKVMRNNFHEVYAQGAVKLPSERSTGVVFTVVALLVAAVWRNSPAVLWTALGAAAALAAVSALSPGLLRPLNVAWFRFGLLLHRVVNPLVMFAIFAIVFVPAGLLMRIWHDPLRTRRMARTTYWIDKGEAKSTSSMRNQF
jgi:hypothetical protein